MKELQKWQITDGTDDQKALEHGRTSQDLIGILLKTHGT
jgi:hypothetical protein